MEKQTKANILKTLVAVKGQEMVCDVLAELDQAFDVLLKQKLAEIIKMIEETTTRGMVYDGKRSKEIINKLNI